jgi:NAD(P)-dependent dehydrogenase (short-subunit alcohol dehydrogenase family)
VKSVFDRGMAMRFQGAVVLITGGTRGIGLQAARGFAAEGGAVTVVARDSATGKQAVRDVDGVSFVQCDVRHADECEQAVGEVLRTHGRLDVLVNNAGVIYRNRTIDETTEEEWDTTFEVNVRGAFLMSKYAIQALQEDKGNIVNVSSYAGLVGFAGAAAYAASKAALVNLTRTMALDHAGEGVRVNCVCPGSVDTEMIQDAWRSYGDLAEAERLWKAKHPLGRIARPDEVSRAILFLASGEASFITGAALPVDGGITAG